MGKILLLLTLMASGFLFAQTPNYKTSVGVRGGEPSGITAKYFIYDLQAIEGIISFWPWGPGIIGLYEMYAPAFDTEGLFFYFGAGAHVRQFRNGWWGNRISTNDYRYTYSGSAIGLDGIVGLEYKLPPIPITLSLDLKPMLEFTTGGKTFLAMDPGLSLRYVFSR
jgi:hypothetical protein